jgi:hypothetical protein
LTRALVALAIFGVTAAPASAQWLTLDAAQAAHALSQIKQYEQMITSAQTELRSLPASRFSATDATQRLQAVQGLLAAARQACANPANVAPSVCRVRENVASQQASSIGRDIADLQGLRTAAAGSAGNLQIQQTNAAALLSVAQQLQEAKAREIATEQAREINDAARLRTYGRGHVGLGSSQ